MTEHLDLESHNSAASIVEKFGNAAPSVVASEAVARLGMRDFDGYVTLKRTLKDVEDLLARRGRRKPNKV